MSNLGLYASTVLIWGSTWLAIKYQLGSVAPAVSVAWRFAAAAGLLAVLARLRGMSLRFGARTHLWLALQGVLLFGGNYISVYLAERTLPSGLVAVLFSLIVLCNIVMLRIFFGAPVKPGALAGALLGVSGIVMLFWPDLADVSRSGPERLGLLYGIASTLIASLGNMAATRSHRLAIPVVTGTAWAMLYGALFDAGYAALAGNEFRFELSLPYIASFAYLTVFGSVLAFLAYLTLLGRIGADRASYTGVAAPVLAMVLSSAVEGLQWNALVLAGVMLCVAGNVLALWVPADRRGPARGLRQPQAGPTR